MPDTTPPPVHLDEVVEALASNPALPPALVRRLFGHRNGFGAVAKRPDLTDEMIAEIIAIDDHWLTHSLALNRHLPHTFRMALAEHPDPGIRTALAARADDATRELFERLLGDTDPKVRLSLAQSPHGPADLRARLATDPDPEIRATLAQWWTQAPEPVRRLLLTDSEDSVRAAACATYFRALPHPVPPADLLPMLLADPVTRAGAVRHCTLDADTAGRLALDPDDEVRKELAEHPDLPPPQRDLLAEDPAPRVMLHVFARQDTPESTRAAIHARILSSVPPTDWLDDVRDLDDAALERQIMGELAASELRRLSLPWVTADPLPYADSPYVCFRLSAAMSDRLPAPVVARLLDDEESSVRTAMALHVRDQVDDATAERIDRSHRPYKRSRWRPADDLPLPVDVLRRLATDPDPRMRRLAPRDPDLPVELARALAADTDGSVRRSIATHPKLPVEELTRLLADPSEHVATAAAGNAHLPQGHMHRILTLAGL
ncbi:HEAT repeat domain-containing protein [Streptomyces sp. NPDC048331]|uniref:HEAT repeat domain-containing protein n=1 Tax=Streptomyces sp. NPDC048331 TaxID=3365534 RepID=UPI003723EE6C